MVECVEELRKNVHAYYPEIGPVCVYYAVDSKRASCIVLDLEKYEAGKSNVHNLFINSPRLLSILQEDDVFIRGIVVPKSAYEEEENKVLIPKLEE